MSDPQTVVLSDNIISPLGYDSISTYKSVLEGKSKLRRYPPSENLPEGYTASMLESESLEEEFSAYGIGEEYTAFERRIILSVSKAVREAGIDPSSEKVAFVISTTKANVDLLDGRRPQFPESRVFPSEAAKAICRFFNNPNTPVVVSNACISGLSAYIEGHRLLKGGRCEFAVVTGSDVQSRFIISGFQSFKALSEEECKPFDAERNGLNVGEAAATVVLGRRIPRPADWVIGGTAVRNDANHISGPSRTGEGSFRALKAAIGDFPISSIAFVNAHGTSTVFNDEMESIALSRAGLQETPVNSLKGVFGHTMGAAGILESIVSMRACDDGILLATRGYSTCGVSKPLNISNVNRKTSGKAFVKLLSGFGGCNAAVLFKKGEICL